jgi:hypothetical protein
LPATCTLLALRTEVCIEDTRLRALGSPAGLAAGLAAPLAEPAVLLPHAATARTAQPARPAPSTLAGTPMTDRPRFRT